VHDNHRREARVQIGLHTALSFFFDLSAVFRYATFLENVCFINVPYFLQV
jgi:hypothetical protein